MRFVYTGNITASGTFVKATTATDTTPSVELHNGIGGIYGYSNLANIVAENAEVHTTIAASAYPNVGILFGFARTETAYAKNCKAGGAISAWNTEDEEYISKSLTENNFFEYLYSEPVEQSVAAADGCTFLAAKPTK
jgi:hypothetical protein